MLSVKTGCSRERLPNKNIEIFASNASVYDTTDWIRH